MLKSYRDISKSFYENESAHLLYTLNQKQRGEFIKGRSQYENLKSMELELRNELSSADYFVLTRGALFVADSDHFDKFCDTAVDKSNSEGISSRIVARIEIAAIISEYSPEENWRKAEAMFDEAERMINGIRPNDQRWAQRHKVKLHLERAMHYTRRYDMIRSDEQVELACLTPAFDSLDQAKWSISVRAMINNAKIRFGMITGQLPDELGYRWISTKGPSGKADWKVEEVGSKK